MLLRLKDQPGNTQHMDAVDARPDIFAVWNMPACHSCVPFRGQKLPCGSYKDADSGRGFLRQTARYIQNRQPCCENSRLQQIILQIFFHIGIILIGFIGEMGRRFSPDMSQPLGSVVSPTINNFGNFSTICRGNGTPGTSA